jgi:predicted small secreted protein
MKDDMIYNCWTDFINDDMYKEYFLDNNTIWFNSLELVKSYIDRNKKRPSDNDKHQTVKQLGAWICTQQKNYKTKERIMKNNIIYNSWIDFINNDIYKEYFLDNNTLWFNSLELVKKYIDMNKKSPYQKDKDNNIKQLGSWISHQKQNYKTKDYIMKDDMIYKAWTDFINNDMYKEYFLDNNTIWFNYLELVKSYIDMNTKRPSKRDKDKNIKQLGYWIHNQQTNYKTKSKIMKIQEIYNQWTDFINDIKYKEYF